MKQSAVSPDCADLFLRSKIFERFEMPAITVGANGVAAEALELTMAVVAVTFDDCLHDCMALPDLAVGPWMFDPTEPVLNGMLPAARVAYVHPVPGGRAICMSPAKTELDSFVGENAVDPERGGSYGGLQKDQRGNSAGLRDELHKGTLARAVGCNIQV